MLATKIINKTEIGKLKRKTFFYFNLRLFVSPAPTLLGAVFAILIIGKSYNSVMSRGISYAGRRVGSCGGV